MIYIYLHGFNSAYDPDADKVKALASIGEVTGITYDTFGSYKDIFTKISAQIPDRDDIVFVGTSLGGFWAAEMAASLGYPSVIINPCYDPRNMLSKYTDIIITNYYTAVTNVLTKEVVETYPQAGITKNARFKPLVLLDMGDEVINSSDTRNFLDGFPMVHWAGGSHRFDHMNDALEHIKKYSNHCSYIEHLE
jgi:predicted esterase YcpF (UPF0227 family)